jgi:hypothetical protein
VPACLEHRHSIGIQLDELCPLLGDIRLVEDRVNRAFRNTCVAVNAIVWINVKHLLVVIKTLHWTDDNAISVFAVSARFANDVDHGSTPFKRGFERFPANVLSDWRAVPGARVDGASEVDEKLIVVAEFNRDREKANPNSSDDCWTQ